MTRKIAFIITIVFTVVLMLIQLQIISLPEALAFGSVTLETAEILPYGIVLIIGIIAALCFSQKSTLRTPQKGWSSAIGWITTFSGAVITMTLAYQFVFELIYPTYAIASNFDMITLLLMLVAGLLGGIMLVMQGFRWMSFTQTPSTVIPWLSLAPAIWMWARLARYEISYASTVDISKNFFTLALPVFASLFFLQFARTIAGIGKQPKNSLLIYALATALVGLAGTPAVIVFMPNGQPLTNLLVAVTDAVVALFALVVAMHQVFAPVDEETAHIAADEIEEDTFDHSADDAENTESNAAYTEETDDLDDEATASLDGDSSLAWTDPPRHTEPLDPPFRIDEKLPQSQTVADKAPPTDTPKLSVDDLLNEIDSL